ncbi:MAG: hypothetical protein U0821_10485 [Chloroflexota bacterium]
MVAQLQSRRHVVDDVGTAIEFCYDQGWTDGLPVVPPTESRVAEFVEAMRCAPDTVVGEIPQRARTVTAEKVAINAVMAGCLPSYAPVVRAAIEALCDPLHNVNGSAASTGGSAPLVIVTGPIAHKLGMNGKGNLLGPASRANATIGRAVRLVLMNVGGATVGVMDKSTIGHAGKYTYCVTEDDESRPWLPFHAQRGVPAEASAVTVFAAEGSRQVDNHFSNTAEGILWSIAGAMTPRARNAGGCFGVILCPEHAAVIGRDGWGERQVREYLAANARMTIAELKRFGRIGGEIGSGDDRQWVSTVKEADDILLLVGGGNAGGFSAVIPPWAGGPGSLPVTKLVQE